MAFVGPLVPVPPPAPQTYANHAYRPVATNVAGLFAVFGFAFAVVYALQRDSVLVALALISLALAVMTLVIMSRTYTVRLQNRIIRLEMQIRLARVGRDAAFCRLSMSQVVALRFASDAELPALIDRAVSEQLTGDQIKRAVTDWQTDGLRT